MSADGTGGSSASMYQRIGGAVVVTTAQQQADQPIADAQVHTCVMRTRACGPVEAIVGEARHVDTAAHTQMRAVTDAFAAELTELLGQLAKSYVGRAVAVVPTRQQRS
jgi:hypothetical protein